MDFQFWGKGDDVVVPEDSFDLGEVGFGEIGAGVDGAIVNAADLERERIGRRGDKEIRTEAAKFTREAIANVERDAERGSGDGHAKGQSRAGKEFVARAASERVGNETKKHGSLSAAPQSRYGGSCAKT